jgi:flavin-dependent dehydrogenase
MIPPLCGDGMAMAIRSAALCAPLAHDFLRGAISLSIWEQRYRQMWHREFDSALSAGRSLQTFLMQPVISDIMLLLGNVMPFLAVQAVHATRGPVAQNL